MPTTEKESAGANVSNRGESNNQWWFVLVLGTALLLVFHTKGRKAKKKADHRRDACDFQVDAMDLVQHLETVLGNNDGSLPSRQFAHAMVDKLDDKYEGIVDLNLLRDTKEAYEKMINLEHNPPRWSFVEQDAIQFEDQAAYLWDIYKKLARVNRPRQM